MGCGVSAITPIHFLITAESADSEGRTGHVAATYGKQSVYLTEKEKVLIRRNWRHLACDLTDRGARVFLRIFVDNPNVKFLFPFKDLEGEELTRDVHFRGHASRFMQAVGAVVDNINDFEQVLAPLLNGLGRRHIHFHGFTPAHFNAFQDAMLAVWAEDLGGKMTQEGREAWVKVFGFIMRELKRGYSEAEEDEKRESEGGVPS